LREQVTLWVRKRAFLLIIIPMIFFAYEFAETAFNKPQRRHSDNDCNRNVVPHATHETEPSQ
jgi:hypothetical protein